MIGSEHPLHGLEALDVLVEHLSLPVAHLPVPDVPVLRDVQVGTEAADVKAAVAGALKLRDSSPNPPKQT
jgi:hypothetical protein